MNISREEYENAIISALQPLLAQNGGYLLSIAGYAGQFDREDALRLWLGKFPAILVNAGEASFSQNSTNFYSEEIAVNVIIGARSWRSQREARIVGISDILIDVRNLLLDKTLSIDIRPIQLARESILDSDSHVVIAVAEYILINDRVCPDN